MQCHRCKPESVSDHLIYTTRANSSQGADLQHEINVFGTHAVSSFH